MRKGLNIHWVFLFLACTSVMLSGCETSDDWSGLKGEYEAAFESQNYVRAEEVAQRLVSVATERFGAESNKTAFALNQLGRAFLEQREYQEALDVFRRGLQIREAIGDGAAQDRATILLNIGTCYWYLGDVESAESELKKAITLYDQLPEKSYDSYVDALITALGISRIQGKYEEAEEIGKKAIAILRVHDFKGKNEKYITILTSLALTYIDVAQYHQADTLLVTAFALAKADSSISDVLKAKIMNTAAQFALETRNYTKAEEMFTMSLSVLKRGLGEYHKDIAVVLNDMGLLYSKMGNNTKADSLYSAALSIHKHNGTLLSLQAAIVYHNVGAVSIEQGEYLRAEGLLKKAVAIKESIVGRDSPQLIPSLRELASLYEKMGKTSEVTALQERIKKIHGTSGAI